VLAHTYLAAGSYPALVTATNAVSTITATTTVLIQSGLQHYYVYLPVVLRAYFSNPCEPNDDHTQACGPLASGQTYPNYPDDTEDWFYVEMGTAGNLQAVVTNYSATGNLLLYAEGNYNDPIAAWGQGGSTMTVTKSVAAGTYYVRVYTASGFNTDQLYDLVSTYP
jgi:Bacterial pre-peptidase C-terminal domain./PKD domain.